MVLSRDCTKGGGKYYIEIASNVETAIVHFGGRLLLVRRWVLTLHSTYNVIENMEELVSLYGFLTLFVSLHLLLDFFISVIYGNQKSFHCSPQK